VHNDFDQYNLFEIAEVRDFVNDPGRRGDVKVRIYNRTNDEQEIKDEDLPWATVVQPVTSAATSKIGVSPSGLKVGSRVLITYLPDDLARQYPIVLGSLGRGDMPEGNENSNGGVSKDSQDSQKNSGGKIKNPGIDNPAYTKKDNQDKKAFSEGKRIHNNQTLDKQQKPKVT